MPARYGRPAAAGTYLAPLDGLRALAIVLVIVWHVAIRVFRLTLKGPLIISDDAGFLHWFPHGEIGVSLFFFISGFIIVRPFLAGTQHLSLRSIGQFYARRLVRIAPPHLLLITLAFLALAVAGYRPERAVNFETTTQSLKLSYLASVFYANGLIFNTPPRLNPPTWSLEIEMQFYLISPAIILLCLRAGRVRAPKLAAFGAGFFALITLLAYDWLGAYSALRWTVFSYLYLFLLGVCVAGNGIVRPAGNLRTRYHDLLFLAGCACLLGTGLFRDLASAADQALRIIATMFAVLAIFYGGMRGRAAAAYLGNRWIALIGAMSYSIYLTHVAVIQAAATLLFKVVDLGNAAANLLLALALLTPAVFAIGMIYYIAVERNFMRLGHHAKQPRLALEPATLT